MDANQQTIPLADRQRIYRILADKFEFGKAVPMATVAFALMEAGVDKEAYGYKKLKAFLADMDDFLSFTDIIAGGVPQRLVTVNKRADWTAERTAAQPEEAVAAADPLAFARAMASTPDYRQGPVPRGIMDELRAELSSFTFFPLQTLEILRQNVPHGTDVAALLDEDWSRAFAAGALRYYEGKVIFPLHVTRSDGTTPIEISIRHVSYQNPEDKPWYLCYVNTYVRPARPAQRLIPSRELEQFAWLGPWEQFLDELAATALPEAWDFEPAPGEEREGGRRNAILKSYICTTFYRLKLEDKVCIDDDNAFAAFNTGLVTRCYDDIYACFEPNGRAGAGEAAGEGSADGPAWRFVGFCTGGTGALGKRLVRLFKPLPEPASYFERKEDLLLDPEREVIVDADHVLVDNVSRLPIPFLEEELRGNDEAVRLLAEVRAGDAETRRDAFARIGAIVADDARLFRRLRRCLEDAIDIARRRVRWNYKTAIPCYHPRQNSMSLLLPLCLTTDEVADVALVVQLMPSGNYQGQTILTMRQAYMNARLICRPDSEWLTVAALAPAADDGDEDEE